MKLIYTSEDRLMVYHFKNLLEQKGIECVIKHDDLASIAGQVPFMATWPELWVADPDMENWAKQIVRQHQADAADPGEDDIWVCEHCGEKHAKQFTECWNCHKSFEA